MKSLIFLTLLSMVVLPATAQHEYIKIYTVQAGAEDKDKAKFVYPDFPDSAKLFNNLKLPDILLGVQIMERKGFELVTLTPAIQTVGIGGIIVTTAVMRRKKAR